MDGIDILIFAFSVILILAFLYAIILAMLPDGKDYSLDSGSNSLGNWIMVGSAMGATRSYIFRSPLINSDGKYVDVDMTNKTLVFGNPITWNFDGLRLFTETTGGFYYVNATESGTIYLSKDIDSQWLYDGFYFYLNSTLTTINLSFINPVDLKLKSVNNSQWIFYEVRIPNLRPTNPFD